MPSTEETKQIQELTELIKKSEVSKAEAMGVDFCGIWPSARTALTALKGILGAIPGVSVFAGSAISIVIAAGDAASNAMCKK
ncbi:hypothetical protein [Nitrosospira sp. NRS527]|uniref:hypothetical protein n=1 Tax=Nitrosospira sp. NRS527 TaxID=155925 RepID=UPI001AF5A13B|nr:hypothetical protein [Nitrosospira sp. NRS527]BCT67321.1 hypothetical protein NNRS527_00903 [Nitrosospira sp. NRS527]